ncbi:hypothetical protein BT69DRAFT_1327765 [Atractiella rhizophila]|nr:hypothetical protein BT69DRAFT_1327765 [Atractiella rhizophila]
MANRVTLIELQNIIQDVVDMQTNGYKVSDNLSVRTLFANHGVIKSPGFTHIPTVLKDNATVMKAVSKDVQRRCMKARNTIKTEIKESIEELQHIEDLTTHLHRFRLGTCARGVSQAEMMLVSMLRQFVKLDLELGSQGKKVTVKVTASKKRKRIDLLGELNDDDEEENLSLWDALDKELAAMSKMKHADRFTYATISGRDLQLMSVLGYRKASQVYAEDLMRYHKAPESDITDSHRAYNAYFIAVLPQILASGNAILSGGQGY